MAKVVQVIALKRGFYQAVREKGDRFVVRLEDLAKLQKQPRWYKAVDGKPLPIAEPKKPVSEAPAKPTLRRRLFSFFN